MAVLFLDPLALAVLLGLLVYVWLVWRGTFRRWFGRSEAWTVLVWPVPLLAIGVPPVAGGVLWLAARLGVEVGGGDVAGAALYAAAYLLPAAGVALWPPRCLLPGWARRRLTALLDDGQPDVPAGAMPAVQGARGHGSRARWVWRVDGVAGRLWLEGSVLRFRAPVMPTAQLDLDEDLVAGLHFADDTEPLLEAPRGGWWSRGRLDITLAEVDRIRFLAVVPWRRDGLVTVEVTGRRLIHLWVADIRRLQRAVTGNAARPSPGTDGADHGAG